MELSRRDKLWVENDLYHEPRPVSDAIWVEVIGEYVKGPGGLGFAAAGAALPFKAEVLQAGMSGDVFQYIGRTRRASTAYNDILNSRP